MTLTSRRPSLLERTLRIASIPIGLSLLSLMSVAPLEGQPSTRPQGKIDPGADYGDELPRIPPRRLSESLQALRTLPGFRVEPVAAEPLIADPVAISFDPRGRLYVVCMRGYSEQAEDHLGQVRLLEDTDGDHRHDRSTVFLDRLSWPTGIICWAGGVFVAVAPDIIYARDTDGDGVADLREVAFTGFGRSNVQGLLNSLRWGLDNRIHGATSSSGGSIRVPGKEAPPIQLRRRDFAFDPRQRALEPTSGGAQHGLVFDDWGRKFVCSNSSHMEMVFVEDRYLARNPHLAAPAVRRLIAVDGGQAEVFRISPVEPWRIVRTRLRVAGVVPGPVEGGGRAAGYFTGSTGVTIYRGSAWPRRLRGQAFIGDVGSNIVHRKVLVPDGVGFRAERADPGREFLASTENWFRPVQMANAPDGTLHVIDMYREVIEHPKSLPPMIKRHLDLTSGRDRGRIYRIVAEGFALLEPPRLDRCTTAELVATLEHPNAWHRETAARLLYERQDSEAVSLLEAMVTTGAVALGRMHALWCLDGLGRLTPERVLHALGDPHPRVREHAVRLAERVAGASADVRERLYALAGDGDLRVRYQLAFTLGEFEGERRHLALARLARRDAGDRWVSLAILSSLARGSGRVFSELLRDRTFRDSTAGGALLAELASQAGAQDRRSDVAEVLRSLETLPGDEASLRTRILRGLGRGLERSGSPLRQLLAASTTGAGSIVDELLEGARRDAGDRNRAPAARAEAIRTLGLGLFDGVREALESFLDSREPQEVQLAALGALSRFARPEVAPMILGAWRGFSPRVRAQATEVLFGRPERLAAVLDAIEREELQPVDLGPTRILMLRSHPDAALRSRGLSLLDGVRMSRRQDVVDAYRPALEQTGDPARGKATFEKICASCHELEGIGHEIGPSLAAARDRGAETLLLNILDPNREILPRYINYLVLTRDGRTLTGIIAAETASSVTLRRGDNEGDTILRLDIAHLESTGLSIMPEGLEKDIDLAGMADLLAYVMSARSTPLRPVR